MLTNIQNSTMAFLFFESYQLSQGFHWEILEVFFLYSFFLLNPEKKLNLKISFSLQCLPLGLLPLKSFIKDIKIEYVEEIFTLWGPNFYQFLKVKIVNLKDIIKFALGLFWYIWVLVLALKGPISVLY